MKHGDCHWVPGCLAGNSLKVGWAWRLNEKQMSGLRGSLQIGLRQRRWVLTRYYSTGTQFAFNRNRVCLSDSRSRSIPISTMHSSTLTSVPSVGAVSCAS